jgi:hypothetical protein
MRPRLLEKYRFTNEEIDKLKKLNRTESFAEGRLIFDDIMRCQSRKQNKYENRE